jgi:hypothetical protein
LHQAVAVHLYWLRRKLRRGHFFQICRVRLRLGAEQVSIEGQAVDVFHREEPLGSVGNQFVKGHEVRVLDVGEGPKLALE